MKWLFDKIRTLVSQPKVPAPMPVPQAPIVVKPEPKPEVVAQPPKPEAKKTMRSSPEGIELTVHFEGLRLKPYLDSVNVPTIGIGSTFYEDGRKVTMQDPPITEARARALFETIHEDFEKKALALIPNADKLTPNQIGAISAFVYNVGIGAFKSSTMLKLIVKGDYAGAADQFLRWDKAGGKPLKGLTVRRYCERALFLGQDWRAAEKEIRAKLG